MTFYSRLSVSDKGRRSGGRDGYNIQLDGRLADDRKRISCDDVVLSWSGSDKGRRSGGREPCAAGLYERWQMTGSGSHAMTLFAMERQR